MSISPTSKRTGYWKSTLKTSPMGMGSTKTEPTQNSERRQQGSSSRPQQGQQTAGGSRPQQGATSGRASADDPNKIDNEIIDSIFRMNSGGDDDRWETGDITSGYETYTSFEGGVTLGGATVSEVQHQCQHRVSDGANCFRAMSH